MKRLPAGPQGSTALLRPIPLGSRLTLIALTLHAGCGNPMVMSAGGAGATDGSAVAAPGGPVGPGERTCAENVTRAVQIPVDLLLLVDSSHSINEAAAGGGSKWSLVVEAFRLFLRDPRSAGLGIGLQFFPARTAVIPCSVDTECPPRTACQDHALLRPPPVMRPPGAPVPPVPPPPNPAVLYGPPLSFCVGAAVPADALVPCTPAQPTCPAGATCALGRFCALSRRDCAVEGQPCPGGVAGDICQAVSTGKICSRLESCDPGDYAQPPIPIAELPGNETVLNSALAGKVDRGTTAMGPALEGALGYLRRWQLDHPQRKAALVLITDGEPTSCSPISIPGLAGEISAARMGTPSIPTYAIGVFSGSGLAGGRRNVEAFASAGGTDMPFVIEATGDLATRLQTALAQIRGAALPCEFLIPPGTGGRVDYGKVNLTFQGTGTPEETVPYVERADRCDPVRGGWYYDVHPMTGVPGRVVACEASCRQFKGDSAGMVSLTFGCATRTIK
jgi:hypothetical protein